MQENSMLAVFWWKHLRWKFKFKFGAQRGSQSNWQIWRRSRSRRRRWRLQTSQSPWTLFSDFLARIAAKKAKCIPLGTCFAGWIYESTTVPTVKNPYYFYSSWATWSNSLKVFVLLVMFCKNLKKPINMWQIYYILEQKFRPIYVVICNLIVLQ